MSIQHRLCLTVRFRDHFSGRPVKKELPVRLTNGPVRPVLRSDRSGARHADGTYRFLQASPGRYGIRWRAPFHRNEAGWTSFEIADPEVMLPVADPASPLEIDLWPISTAPTAPDVAGVRGKLVGADVAGLTVRIALQTTAFDRFTRSDQSGEFLFLPPGALPPGPSGVQLKAEVIQSDGTLRNIQRTVIAGAVTVGNQFSIPPQTVSRVFFELA